MANVDEQSKERLLESLTKLAKFGRNPRDGQAWNDARIALGELGDIAGRFLTNRPQEDVAFTSSLTELDGFAENLRDFPEGEEATRHFEVSLGDIEYRVKRLFGVAVL